MVAYAAEADDTTAGTTDRHHSVQCSAGSGHAKHNSEHAAAVCRDRHSPIVVARRCGYGAEAQTLAEALQARDERRLAHAQYAASGSVSGKKVFRKAAEEEPADSGSSSASQLTKQCNVVAQSQTGVYNVTPCGMARWYASMSALMRHTRASHDDMRCGGVTMQTRTCSAAGARPGLKPAATCARLGGGNGGDGGGTGISSMT